MRQSDIRRGANVLLFSFGLPMLAALSYLQTRAATACDDADRLSVVLLPFQRSGSWRFPEERRHYLAATHSPSQTGINAFPAR
jgi:hypothetical protein